MDTALIETLLKAPPFTRENYESFLYEPYSKKLRRRVFIYTHDGYKLWIRLESDPEVVRYNERPPKIPVPISANKAKEVAPRAISVGLDGIVSIHTFRAKDETSQPNWVGWAVENGFRHVEWSTQKLEDKPPYLNNVAQLLRFSSRPDPITDFSLPSKLLECLKSYRKTTLHKLINQHPSSDPDEVMIAIATLILDRRIYSDIHKFPLSQITEISAYESESPRNL
jgi:hypothetical protein